MRWICRGLAGLVLAVAFVAFGPAARAEACGHCGGHSHHYASHHWHGTCCYSHHSHHAWCYGHGHSWCGHHHYGHYNPCQHTYGCHFHDHRW